MSKPNKNPYQQKKIYPYPSEYGSHSSMIDEKLTEELNKPNMVVCRDEHGTYITERKRLDDGLADINRYDHTRR
jgi:hypothetical protein